MNSMPGSDEAEAQDAWTLSVDLGCAQLAAVVTTSTGVREALEFDGQLSMPGGVWMDSDGEFVIGTAALRQAMLAPQRWEPAPVRLLGETENRTLARAPFDARDAVAKLLSHVQITASDRLGRPPARTVLVCPQPWPVSRRTALVDAARHGGMDHLEIMGHADAAGRYLRGAGLLGPGATVAVADIGAGSVSTAVIRGDQDGIEVLSSGWLDGLGGTTLDLAIFQRVVRSVLTLSDPRLENKLLQPPDARWRRLRESLMREVRRAREELTRYGTVRVHTDAVADASLELTRHDLDLLIRPQIDQMVHQLQATVASSGVSPDRLDSVALLGGAGATPLLARVIVAAIGKVPRLVMDPQLALAFGGATIAPSHSRLPVPAGRGGTDLSNAGSSPAPLVIAPRLSDISPADGVPAVILPAPTPAPLLPPPPPPEPPKDSGDDAEPTPEPVDDAQPTPEPVDDAQPTPEPDAAAEAEVEAEAGVEAEAASTEPEPEAELEAVADESAEPEPEPDAEPEVVADEPEAEVALEPEREVAEPEAAEPEVEAEPEALTEPETEPETSTELPAPAPLAVPDPATLRPPGPPPRPAFQPPRPPIRQATDDAEGPSRRRPRAWLIAAGIIVAVLLAGIATLVIRPTGDDTAAGQPSAAPAPGSSPSTAASGGADDQKWAAWGEDAALARAWSAVVPTSPAAKGSQGQTCKAARADSPYSIYKILCTFPNGVRMTLLEYLTEADRNEREKQIASGQGVTPVRTLENFDLDGKQISGRLYEQKTAVWRWWVLEDDPRSAVYTRWPGHNSAQLQTWWDKNAPFT